MDQNSNILFTNSFLRLSISQSKQPHENSTHSASSLKQAQHSQGVPPLDADTYLRTANTSLNYSADPLLQEDMDNQASLLREQSLQIATNQDNARMLRQLLSNENEAPPKFSIEPNHGRVEQLKASPDQGDDQHQEANQQLDYSEELSILKLRLVQIQSLAQQEIARLKRELQKQHETQRKGLRQSRGVEVGVNTERDLRDLEIEMLRESLMRHMALNKQLLMKQVVERVGAGNECLQKHLNSVAL